MQDRKKKTTNKPPEKAQSQVSEKQAQLQSKAIERERQRTRTGYIIASLVVAVILIIVGFSYYQNYTAPFRRTVIKIDDTNIRMDYFLKRVKLAGVEPMYLFDALVNEQIIKLEAPDYGIEATEEDINERLRVIAGGGSGNITDSELKEWYRHQLNESGLSDVEYKDITRTGVLASRLQEHLARKVPTTAEQVHLHLIALETYEDAEKIRARWETGEIFADLAQEASLEEESKEKGGDIGWVPRGLMYPAMEETVFNLDIGDVSEPQFSEESILLFMVSEKAVVRELDEDSLQALKARALEDWLGQEKKLHEVSFHGLNNGFDSETNAWINWQISKMKESDSGGSSGGQ
ncbi:peptidylprolyl isomerase [Chloroflexota bacterium]